MRMRRVTGMIMVLLLIGGHIGAFDLGGDVGHLVPTAVCEQDVDQRQLESLHFERSRFG